MSLKDTFKQMRDLLCNITSDLEKSENGNKAASQRVRTGTVKLEKVAKLFRKESISNEKKNKGQKRPSKAAGSKAKSSSKKVTKSKAPAKAKSASVKAKPKAKAAQASTSFRSRHLSAKRATAKLPTKRMSAR
jgi:hypothetical protein